MKKQTTPPPVRGKQVSKHRYEYLATCSECGGKRTVRVNHHSMISDHCWQCGRKFAAAARATHGEAHTQLYSMHSDMCKRCSPNIKGEDRKNYFLRNIKVCPEWRDYAVFREWALSNGFSLEGNRLTIDRKNGKKGYNPENCRAANRTDQARNRRSTRLSMGKAREIRAAYAAGEVQHSIAKRYGFAQGYISDVVLHKIWKEDASLHPS